MITIERKAHFAAAVVTKATDVSADIFSS